jgi:transposase
MVDGTRVAVGSDVHKSSIRLAAVRADELLEERTLPYDPLAVQRALVRWPGARVCYAKLRCLRGIDTLTAVGLVCEIGDFQGFARAEEFMSFIGLVPSEHSSGEKRRPGSITKVGNTHVRRLLVEAAWHARLRPKVGYDLARRQRDQGAPDGSQSCRADRRISV